MYLLRGVHNQAPACMWPIYSMYIYCIFTNVYTCTMFTCPEYTNVAEKLLAGH